jgi:tetratricopeptide (TPR) repeat protein
MEEAIRAFETVLLLDPDNREAQVLLGNCFEVESIGRPAEARECYRKIIESPIQDKWSEQARQHLNFTFDYYHIPLEEKLKFFETTAAQTTVPVALEYYRGQIKSIQKEIALKQPGSEAQQLMEASLFSSITNAISNDVKLDMGLNDFVESYGTNRTAAARRLAELYPRLIAQTTNLTPYLLAAVVTVQVDTNAPLVREFDSLLDEYIAHPEKLNSPKAYWQRIWGPVSRWSFEHGRYDLAVKVLTESLRLDASAGQDCDEQVMALGFAYVYLEQWQEALDIFESCSNRPPHYFYWPVWGGRQDFIITERWRDYCREKLGLPAVKDPREFDLGKSILRLHAPGAFVVDQNGLWVGTGGQLLHLDFELHTNLVIGLPFDAATPVTTLCVTSSNIWIATRGAGLIDFNKSSQQFRRFTETNGLAMNSISALHWSGKTLWMAYNGTTGGGLGQLDPASGKIKSYMRELRTRGLQFDTGRPNEEKLPPGVGVGSIVSDPSGNPWMFITGGILKYDTVQDTWNPIPRALGKAMYGFTADASWLAEAVGVKSRNVEDHTETGRSPLTNHLTVTNRIVTKAERDVLDLILRFDYLNYPRGTFSEKVYNSDEVACYVSLAVQSWSDQQWQTIQDDTAIPNPPNTMTLAGDELWVGGTGYIARVDLRQGKARNYCRVAVDEVDRIQIGGGYAWIQLGWYLYRVPLSSLQ